MSNAQFKADLSAFVKRANGNADLVVRKVALDLLSSIVMKSPVDTGRFRGNWFVQEDVSPVQSSVTDKSGETTILAGATAVGQFSAGGKVYILNHLPYSIELEHGHSKQAPAGMVKITVAEFEQYVRGAAAELSA